MVNHKVEEYEHDDWEKKARAAGWSPPVESGLRVEEMCPHKVSQDKLGCFDKEGELTLTFCVEHPCDPHTGTISRLPTVEELIEAVELEVDHFGGEITLKSGLRVVMV